MKANGTVFKYGDNVDTDVIIPARYLNSSDPAELAQHCMEDIDKEFVKKVQKGDIIVANKNFGCGSSREHAPIAIKAAGVSCVIAETFARIFYRNSINIGLPIIECPEAAQNIEAGDEVEVDFDNQALDHRLRVLAGTGLDTPWHYADSIFEVAKRSNSVSGNWENPCNAQHQQLFVNVHEDQAGMTVANHGLNEYEILPEDNTIALTLHRGVREMGDWGEFLTPQAQCLGKQHREFALYPHGAGEDLMRSYEEAYAYSSSLWGVKSEMQDASIPDGFTFLKYSTDTLLWTALKVQEETGDVIFRGFNASETEGGLALETERRIYRSNVLGEKKEYLEPGKLSVRGYGIFTAGLEKKDGRSNTPL